MLELAGIDFQATLRTILHEVKVNTLEINGKMEAFNRQIEMIIKNHIEMLKLKYSITKVNDSWYSLNSRMEGTEEREKRLKKI